MPGNCEVWSAVRRTPGALALYALVAFSLVGATTAFVAMNKQVTVSVDGKSHQLTTFARSVSSVLEAAEVEYTKRDLVVPAPSEPVSGDTKIVVTHARKLKLTVNGKASTKWVTANTVKQALGQLDVKASEAYLSASRSDRLPLSGSSLTVRTPRMLTIKVAGNTMKRKTTAPTVRKALNEAGIKIGQHDKVSAQLAKRPSDGQVVKITQILNKPETETVRIDYETTRKKNPEMYKGEEKVVQEGREGIKKVTVAMVRQDGKKVEKVLSKRVTRKPRKEIVEYGTKERETESPSPSDSGSGDSSSGGSAPEVGGSVSELNWSALAECESGGDPNAVNPAGPYYGLYQFSQSTWESVGGSGVPTDASASEQTRRAQMLYQRAGDESWPECGENLYG